MALFMNFSAIPGVKEDVTEIVMNIKSLAIKNHSDNLNETKTMYIDATWRGCYHCSGHQM